jgi:hypothetical protein
MQAVVSAAHAQAEREQQQEQQAARAESVRSLPRRMRSGQWQETATGDGASDGGALIAVAVVKCK